MHLDLAVTMEIDRMPRGAQACLAPSVEMRYRGRGGLRQDVEYWRGFKHDHNVVGAS